MKTNKLLPLLFLACTKLALGQITFQKTFNDIPDTSLHQSPYTVAYDIKQTYDGGYIMTGFTGNDEVLIKLDENGDTVWTKHWVYESQVGYSVLQTCDSAYISAGTGINKTDKNGNLLWAKNYPAAYSPTYRGQSNLIKTNDCGFILASSTDSFGTGGYDMYVIKTDTGGNPLWSKTYGGAGDDEATTIQQTADGGYIVAGFTNSFGISGYDAYLIKTDVNGDTLWTKTYHKGPSAIGGVYSIQQTYDRGYIMLGAYLIKTDSIGNVMWSNNFSGNSIHQTIDTGYVFLSDNLLIKTNSAGNPLWARSFPGPDAGQGSRIGITILQTNDGGYVETDYTQITTNYEGQYYINLNKTDVNGQSGCNETNTTVSVNTVVITAAGTATVVTSPVTTVADSSVGSGTELMSITTACSTTGIPEPRTAKSPIIFPNPISPDGSLTIFLNEDLKNADLTIFTITGQPLYSEKVNGKGQMVLDALKNKLSAGMYFIRIMQGETMMVVKFVVMN